MQPAVIPGLTGKVAFLTGVGGGIGQAVARRLLADGVAVVGCDLEGVVSPALAPETAARFTAVNADVRDQEELRRAFQIAVDQGEGSVDVVVNNAGIRSMTSIEAMATAEWDDHFDVNVRSALWTTQLAIPGMRARGAGSIVNIGSIAALVGYTRRAAYGSSKAALSGFTRQAGVELAVYGIRVNAVAPGFVDTPLNQYGPEVEKQILKSVPLGRRATADEVAYLVAFLASDLSRYITASTLVIDGGLTEGLVLDAAPWHLADEE